MPRGSRHGTAARAWLPFLLLPSLPPSSLISRRSGLIFLQEGKQRQILGAAGFDQRTTGGGSGQGGGCGRWERERGEDEDEDTRRLVRGSTSTGGDGNSNSNSEQVNRKLKS
ncbi:hypothetical protein BDA96_03G439400 [Sorghum bicolor]|uniref:Uncharacterized protein n=1 Tax=Sorghum bicolor TaxID=4558 RepID=A0A921RK12_SORBI|nr:hypothetical protein BDA96_03G439400 [Sorghum bicolor]